MRVAEELRKHADLAIKEGGMWFSGEYLDAIARRAESEQAENAKLRAQECTLESIHGYCDPYVRTAYVVELSCHTLDAWDDPVPPSYCPYCGRRVVEVD